MKLFTFHPGETFVVNFILPFHPYDVKAVIMSFRDRDRVVYENIATSFAGEGNDEVDVDGKTVIEKQRTRVGYLISQSESLLFKENHDYVMQLNVYGPNSSRISSKEIKVVTKEQQLIDPVIGGDSALNTTYSTYQYGSATGITGSGTLDYNQLINKPKINSKILTGDRTLPEYSITTEQIDQITLGE